MIDLREDPPKPQNNDPFDGEGSGAIMWLFIFLVIIAMIALNVAEYLMRG